MKTVTALLEAVGQHIRARRVDANLTQNQLGKKAGIVGKYVSEIERGTRDIPLSTLYSIVEQGLGLQLRIELAVRNGSRPHMRLPPLPAPIDEVARKLAALPADARARVLGIIRGVLELVDR